MRAMAWGSVVQVETAAQTAAQTAGQTGAQAGARGWPGTAPWTAPRTARRWRRGRGLGRVPIALMVLLAAAVGRAGNAADAADGAAGAAANRGSAAQDRLAAVVALPVAGPLTALGGQPVAHLRADAGGRRCRRPDRGAGAASGCHRPSRQRCAEPQPDLGGGAHRPGGGRWPGGGHGLHADPLSAREGRNDGRRRARHRRSMTTGRPFARRSHEA